MNDHRHSAARSDESWERETIRELATNALLEQRRGRRWSIFFRLLLVAYIAFVTTMAFRDQLLPGATDAGGGDAHTALLALDGQIVASGEGITADGVIEPLSEAFANPAAKAIVLRINSPGGSPVQSGIIYDEVRRLRAEYPDKKVYAVVHDMAASGGYYIAAAADEIYVDKASLVGSIGVIVNGFGFVGAMEKLGVERRMITAGDNKGMLDPFSPSRESEVAHMQELVAGIHEQFTAAVKAGRGDRLVDDPSLFSGAFWTGEEAIALGLADGEGNEFTVARDIVGAEQLREYAPPASLLDQLTRQIGVAFYGALRADLLAGVGELR